MCLMRFRFCHYVRSRQCGVGTFNGALATVQCVTAARWQLPGSQLTLEDLILFLIKNTPFFDLAAIVVVVIRFFLLPLHPNFSRV